MSGIESFFAGLLERFVFDPASHIAELKRGGFREKAVAAYYEALDCITNTFGEHTSMHFCFDAVVNHAYIPSDVRAEMIPPRWRDLPRR